MAPKPAAAAPDSPPAPEITTPPDPYAGLVPGRVVWYWPRLHEARSCAPGPWASVVTAVGPLPGEVTLNVHLPLPMPVGVDPVMRFAPVKHTSEKEEGCWDWIPKQ